MRSRSELRPSNPCSCTKYVISKLVQANPNARLATETRKNTLFRHQLRKIIFNTTFNIITHRFLVHFLFCQTDTFDIVSPFHVLTFRKVKPAGIFLYSLFITSLGLIREALFTCQSNVATEITATIRKAARNKPNVTGAFTTKSAV